MQRNVGDVRITMVRESLSPTPVDMLFADAEPKIFSEHSSWLEPEFVDGDGNLMISIHALVVESGGKTIVVDTCAGDHTLPGYDLLADVENTFLADLAAAGFDPETIDYVLCTHLHFDHVGWNTTLVDGARVPTFPNARYLFGQIEHDHWSGGAAGPESLALTFADAVTPVVDAGRADFVGMDHRITDEVRLVPTPGHTPGHVSVVIESGGSRAVITGDVVHHPVQFLAPHWSMMADVDGVTAERTRRAFRSEHADADVLVFGTHFAGTSCGYLRSEGDTYRFDPAP